jgi:cell division septation protein DedD
MERSASAAPVIRAAATPMRQAAVTKPAAVAAAAPAPVAVAATAERAAPAQTGISNWVVQIGAVNDARYLSASWKLSGATAYEAQGYRKLSSQATINGQVWHRMALAGFASRSAAMNLCATLRAKGQSCFVRQDAGVSSATRMARAEPAKPTQTVRKQIASR